MTEADGALTARELVELWAETAAGRLRVEQATPGKLGGTELNRLGELLISAASWLTEDAGAAKRQAREDRVAALKRSAEYAALPIAEQMKALGRV